MQHAPVRGKMLTSVLLKVRNNMIVVRVIANSVVHVYVWKTSKV